MSVIFSRNLTSLVVTNDGSKPVSPLTKIYSNVEFGTHLNIGSPEMPSLFLPTVDKGLRGKKGGNFLWGDIVTTYEEAPLL